MTTAAESEQQTSADAERPTNGAAPGDVTGAALGGLALFPGLGAADAGLCIDGVCRLPGAKA
ncbi:hypothetical protein [Microbacterium sp. NPDC056052]|uniref:hypothetical protein n=1 Tax=Microbacterium sp. NPDC056052 TaxID=3345695 RepID=UPI0035DDAE43